MPLNEENDTTETSEESLLETFITDGRVNTAVLSQDGKFLLYDVITNQNSKRYSDRRKLYLGKVSDLPPEKCLTMRHKELMGLGPEVRHILGTCHNRLVFLDHDNWVCTSIIGWDMGAKRRLYFLPGDWINDPMFSLALVNESGTLLCARYGEVAIVRYNGRL